MHCALLECTGFARRESRATVLICSLEPGGWGSRTSGASGEPQNTSSAQGSSASLQSVRLNTAHKSPLNDFPRDRSISGTSALVDVSRPAGVRTLSLLLSVKKLLM